VCPQKANYFLAQRRQIASSNFRQSDLRDNYDYVFRFTCVMLMPGKKFDKLHFGNKQNSQTAKP